MKSRYVICSITSSGLEMPPDQEGVPDVVDLFLDVACDHPYVFVLFDSWFAMSLFQPLGDV